MLKQRKIIRLQKWNYSDNGYYFVTICTKNRVKWFGEVVKQKMELSEIGRVAENVLQTLPYHHSVFLDEYTIMPNHLHIILIIDYRGFERRDIARNVLTNKFGHLESGDLSTIIRSFKSEVTKQVHTINPSFSWHSRFYDHIIRSQSSLHKIKEYIRNNPLHWDRDEYFV